MKKFTTVFVMAMAFVSLNAVSALSADTKGSGQTGQTCTNPDDPRCKCEMDGGRGKGDSTISASESKGEKKNSATKGQ